MMRKLHYPLRVLASAILIALAAILLLVPATGIPQSDASKSAGPPFNDNIDDPAEWGKAFPKHYELYKKSVDMQRTKHGGSEAVPHVPTQADPRSVVARSKVDEDKGLKAIWQGYAFSEDFREERGHAHMLEDQRLTKRQVVVKQPGACVNCHASMYLAYKKAGNGDITKGFEKINAMPYAEASKLVTHPVACIDCHDGSTLALRVTRPAFIEGMRAYKASQGVKDYDVNKQATSAEMRAYVCGQCHVEYYFKGPEKRLVYPWSKGLKVEQITAYYDEIGFRDWTHKDTGAPALKAQHPEFEMWNQGSHARAGVTCVDCHMPSISRVVHRPLGAQPDAERRGRVRHLPQEARREDHRRGPAGPRPPDPGPALGAAREGDGRRGRADRRPEGGEGRGAQGRGPASPPSTCSDARSSTSTSSRRRTPPASMRRRRPRASWASRSTSRARARSRCATRPSSRPFPIVDIPPAPAPPHRRRRRSAEGRWPRLSTRSEHVGQPGLLARAWRRLRSPSARWSVLALVVAGLRGRRRRGHRHAGDGPRHRHRRVLRRGLPFDAVGREGAPGKPCTA